MKLFQVEVVTKPICTDPDCDIKENPDHYVRIRLTPEVVSMIRRAMRVLSIGKIRKIISTEALYNDLKCILDSNNEKGE